MSESAGEVVKRLRERMESLREWIELFPMADDDGKDIEVMAEAAALIDAQSRAIEAARAALEPFAKAAKDWDGEEPEEGCEPDWPDKTLIVFQRAEKGDPSIDCTVGNLRAAAAAIAALPKGDG